MRLNQESTALLKGWQVFLHGMQERKANAKVKIHETRGQKERWSESGMISPPISCLPTRTEETVVVMLVYTVRMADAELNLIRRPPGFSDQ